MTTTRPTGSYSIDLLARQACFCRRDWAEEAGGVIDSDQARGRTEFFRKAEPSPRCCSWLSCETARAVDTLRAGSYQARDTRIEATSPVGCSPASDRTPTIGPSACGTTRRLPPACAPSGSGCWSRRSRGQPAFPKTERAARLAAALSATEPVSAPDRHHLRGSRASAEAVLRFSRQRKRQQALSESGHRPLGCVGSWGLNVSERTLCARDGRIRRLLLNS